MRIELIEEVGKKILRLAFHPNLVEHFKSFACFRHPQPQSGVGGLPGEIPDGLRPGNDVCIQNFRNALLDF